MKDLKKDSIFSGLKYFYNKFLVLIGNLKSLGVKPNTYSLLLCLILLKYIPIDLTLDFNRNLKDG